MLGSTTGYAFDTVTVVAVYDQNDFFGHQADTTQVLLFINPNRELRYEYHGQSGPFESQKQGVIEQLTLTSATFNLTSEDGTEKAEIGCKNQVVIISQGVFLIFTNSTSAQAVVKKLEGWLKAIDAENAKVEKDKQKDEKTKGSVAV